MSRVFKTKAFKKAEKGSQLTNDAIRSAVKAAEKGTIAAFLGGDVIKIRVARPGSGKSSGYRVIVAFRKEDKSFLLYMFAKNESDNINEHDLGYFKKAAAILLALTDAQIQTAIDAKEFEEIT